MGYLEYMAVLVSPSPKDTLKAIEERHKIVENRKKHEENVDGPNEPVIISAESKEFKSTTFYDTIAAEAGEESAAAIRNFFGDNVDDSSRPVTYIARPEQMSYFDRAIAAHQKGEDILPLPSLDTQLMQMHMDSIEF